MTEQENIYFLWKNLLKNRKTDIFIKVRQKTEVSHSTSEITSVFPLD